VAETPVGNRTLAERLSAGTPFGAYVRWQRDGELSDAAELDQWDETVRCAAVAVAERDAAVARVAALEAAIRTHMEHVAPGLDEWNESVDVDLWLATGVLDAEASTEAPESPETCPTCGGETAMYCSNSFHRRPIPETVR